MNAIERLRERVDSLVERAPQMDAEDWAVEALPLLFDVSAKAAAVDALYQAAREVVASDGTGRKRIDALAAAIRRVEAEA